MSDCHVCGAARLEAVLDLGRQPVSSHFTREAGVPVVTHALSLGVCHRCGVLQVTEPWPWQDLVPPYDWITYREPEGHLDALVDRLVGTAGVSPKSSIVGLTFKDRTTLERLDRRGFREARLIDPHQALGATHPNANIETVHGLLTPERASRLAREMGAADVLVARHILEHAMDARSFLAALRNLLKPGGHLVVEVPEVSRNLRRQDYAMIWEEHNAYFLSELMPGVMTRAGFEVRAIDRAEYPFEDVIVVHARKAAEPPPCGLQPSDGHAVAASVAAARRFGAAFPEWTARYERLLEDLTRDGRRLAAYGAGHLTCAFLQFHGLARHFAFVVDDTPHKQGLHLPCSGLEIVPRSRLDARQIALCLFGFTPEIEAKVAAANEAYRAGGGRFASMLADSPTTIRAMLAPTVRHVRSKTSKEMPGAVGGTRSRLWQGIGSCLVRTIERYYRTPLGKWALVKGLRTSVGRSVAYGLLKVAEPDKRRLMIEGIQSVLDTVEDRAAFSELARRRYEQNPDDPKAMDCYAIALINGDDPARSWKFLSSEEVKQKLPRMARGSSLIGARLTAAHTAADFRAAVETARVGVEQEPERLRQRIDYLKAAFSAGKIRNQRLAIEFFGRQFMMIADHPGSTTDREIEKIVDAIEQATRHSIKEHVETLERRLGRRARVGVFYLSSTLALGHAILDPFHFLSLNRGRFDRVYFIGPPRSSYRPASAACLQIIEQYGDYLETHSDLLMNLSWMSLGEHTIGNLTIVIDHYWELLRKAVHRTRDPDDDFRHNAWHITLPAYYKETGARFCAEAGIDLDRPLVVMHVRDKGYHEIWMQSFRDSAVENYREAVLWLIEKGYQVVRIGDTKMPRLDLDHEHYHELPFLDGYRHEIDPFLISRSHFMIGCQSGPCAFARALGVPLLTVNAVLHYTLLPTTMEMACFKRYFRETGGARKELDLFAALDAGAYHFDNSYQFERAGITVENALPNEILASVKDMVAWLNYPELAETPRQVAIREKIERVQQWLVAKGPRLLLPIADYLGICLPGYRVSPSVEHMRWGKGTHAPTATAAANGGGRPAAAGVPRDHPASASVGG